jgi:hypothetical protein
MVRAAFAMAVVVALVAVVLTASLVAAEHFRADLHHHTDLDLAGLAALGLLTEVADVVTRIVRWGFRRSPSTTLAAHTPLTWAPPPPESPALAPVVPLRRRDRKEQEQERRQVQAALILGPQAVPPPAPTLTPSPERQDREPRTHLVSQPTRQREPRSSRQPKGLFVRWAHAERDGKVAVWVCGPAGTRVVEGADLDAVENEVTNLLRVASLQGETVEVLSGDDLRAVAREWAERAGTER